MSSLPQEKITVTNPGETLEIVHELDQVCIDGITKSLYWRELDNSTYVTVDDRKQGLYFELEVEDFKPETPNWVMMHAMANSDRARVKRMYSVDGANA